MIKNTLVLMESEISNEFDSNYNNWDEFIEKLTNILDDYKLNIYKCGKMILNKKIGKSATNVIYTNLDNDFLNNYNLLDFIKTLKEAIIKCSVNLQKEQLYDQIITIIISEFIKIFKISQINECKNQNITKIKILSDEIYSCSKCKTISNFVYDTNNFDFSLLHSYCKLTILPIIDTKLNINTQFANFNNVPQYLVNDIKLITTKLSIQLKSFISKKIFNFENTDNLIINADVITIPIKFSNLIKIDELIIRELLKDKLENMINFEIWKNLYIVKKDSSISGDNCIIYKNPFINNLASISYNEYFIQSYIYYILYPNVLQQIDNNAYNQLFEIFKKEFIKG